MPLSRKSTKRRRSRSNLDLNGKKKFIQWTERARLQVIEAVIRVEEEICMGHLKNGTRPSSTGKQPGKWKRIADRLPPNLRERVNSLPRHKKNHGDEYKCQRLFSNVLYEYRGVVRGMVNGGKHKRRRCMTQAVYDMIEKCEKLRNTRFSTPAEDSLKSNGCNRITVYQAQVSSTDNSNNQEDSPEGRSIGTAKEHLATEARFDESLHTTLDGLKGRLAQEFSTLRSWVSSQLISEGKHAMHEMTSSAFAERRRVHLPQGPATEPLDCLSQRILNTMMDNQIHAWFQKLRIKFALELKNTSLELDREVLQATRVD